MKIDPKMTLLQIVESAPLAEGVLRQYDNKTGCCLLCNHLFDSLEAVADSYSLNLNEVLTELNELPTHK